MDDFRKFMNTQPARPLSEETCKQVRRIKDNGDDFLAILNAMPPSAEMTLAKRKVEEAVMWAVKAVTA